MEVNHLMKTCMLQNIFGISSQIDNYNGFKCKVQYLYISLIMFDALLH